MGYQLWTSPLTGYRRRGTRLRDFNETFGHKIAAGAIFEPLKSCPAEAPSDEMRRLLEQRDFDVAGVRSSADSAVMGFVRRTSLNGGVVRDHMEAIPDSDIVDVSTSVNTLLEALQDKQFVFVRCEGVTTGIITRADLNKPVVRVYFFGLISLLEIHLSFWVAQKYPDDSWQAVIGDNRVGAALRTQAERARRGQELPLRECLQFSDKHKLVISHNDLRADLKLGSKNKAARYLSDAENLRNTLAHSQYDLVVGSSWSDLIALVRNIETTVAVSDHRVEAYAGGMATQDIGALW